MSTPKWIPASKKAEQGSASQKQLTPSLKSTKSITNSVTVEYELSGLWSSIVKEKGKSYTSFSLPSGGRISEIGAPDLPVEGLFIAVPDSAINVKVSATSKTEEILKGTFNVNPVAKNLTEIQSIEGEALFEPDEKIYSENKLYPGKYVEFIDTKSVEGVRVAHIMVYPVQYNPKTQKVTIVKKIIIKISFDSAGTKKIKSTITSQSFVPVIPDLIIGYENFVNIEEMMPEEATPKTKGTDPIRPIGSTMIINEIKPNIIGGLSFLHSLKNKAKNSELIIITSEALRPAMEPYRSARSHSPFNAMFATTEKIVAEFPAGSLKQSIKDYITYAFNNYAIRPRYIVLGGDIDVVPTDLVTRGSNVYANDNFYVNTTGDECPELIISRIPSSNSAEMQSVCNFIADYYNQRGPDWAGGWLNKILMVAYENSQPTYVACSDQINASISGRFATQKLYGHNTNKNDVVSAINNGASIVHYRGHGSSNTWSSSNGINTADVGSLNQGGKIPFVLNICCDNGMFDNGAGSTCLAEAWVRSRKAIANFAASRPSWTSPNNDFSKHLFEAIMEGEVSPGRIMLRAKLKMIMNHSGSAGHMDNMIMYNMFGDPTANVVSSADFLRGIWNMDHDGWQGQLTISALTNFVLQKNGNAYYPIWYFTGTYKGQNGQVCTVFGKIGGKDPNNSNNQPTNHWVEFWIKFDAGNNQRFNGYVHTWARDEMSGTTWWSGNPYGFNARKI